MRTGARRLLWPLTLLTAVLMSLVVPTTAVARPDAATVLARTYAPVMALQPQARPCGPGEAYRPTVVNLVLGNSHVVLRDSAGRVVRRAPDARYLSGAPDTDYLDFPGDPLKPGCSYEKQFRRWYGQREPSIYAHVASDPEHPGKLAVQYWFYYTFNDFSDKHESDWEMAQVDFDAATPAEALKVGPYEVALAQHAGGERGPWSDDPKLTTDGTHPIVHVATGSHADYFQRELYLGKGGTAIFGCDDTRSDTLLLHPRVVVLPDTPVPARSPYAWLNFKGRWGQKEAGINNGPFGPAGHEEQWQHPIGWAEGLRTSSVTVPGGSFLGISATNFFCTGTTDASSVIDWATLHPTPFLGLLAVLLIGLLTATRRTAWRPSDPRPVCRARGAGQILGSARRLYRESPRTFVEIGLIFIPFSLAAGGAQWILFHLTGIERLVALDGRGGPVTAVLALLVGGVAATIATAAVTAAVSAALAEIEAGRRVSAPRAYAIAWRNARALSGATAIEFLALLLLALTVIGLPFAIWAFVRTSFFVQLCVLEPGTAKGSILASARLTRGRWWRTFGFTLVVDIITIASGPILGVLVLLATSQSLTFINLISSLVYALMVPYAAIALTLYYFDLQARAPRAG